VLRELLDLRVLRELLDLKGKLVHKVFRAYRVCREMLETLDLKAQLVPQDQQVLQVLLVRL
jgi:hypothetical protein